MHLINQSGLLHKTFSWFCYDVDLSIPYTTSRWKDGGENHSQVKWNYDYMSYNVLMNKEIAELSGTQNDQLVDYIIEHLDGWLEATPNY